jgi:hypothetical protein
MWPVIRLHSVLWTTAEICNESRLVFHAHRIQKLTREKILSNAVRHTYFHLSIPVQSIQKLT